jgi:putative tryptophan/tyrosine transport system substrate-binding protein
MDDMKRRDFILMVGGATLLSRAARGQQTSPVVGVLGFATLEAVRANFAAVQARLAEMGYVEGHNLAIEYRWADYQQDRLAALAGELVRRRVAAIYASSGPAVSAAKAATTTIPIIFFTGFDPVESGFVNSLNRPGGNVTGVFILSSELIFKRLELLHEMVPAAKTIAFFRTQTAIKSGETSYESLRQAAEAIGVKLLFFNVTDASDLDESFARTKGAGAGGAERPRIPEQPPKDNRPRCSPQTARDLFHTRIRRRRWLDKLRTKLYGRLPSGRRLCWPRAQGRKT